jgi:flagellar motor switch protein FliN/FliY
VTTEEALEKLIQSTAEAVSGVLEMFCPGGVELAGVTAAEHDAEPLGALPPPIVVSHVSYVDGVTGGNVFAMPLEGARALAAAMMGQEPPQDAAEELTELEQSAVAEAMNQMMAAAAAATGAVLGQGVEISVPEVGVFASAGEALAAHEEAPHLARAHFKVLGVPARLVQLVPNAFVVRVTRALDELGAEYAPDAASAEQADAPGGGAVVADSLRDVPVRVWAELGRARMHTGKLVGMPAGSVVELDRRADDPVDVYVNGLPFAKGRLIVVDGAEWAVRIEALADAGAMENRKGVMG